MKVHTKRPRSGNGRRIWDELTVTLSQAPDELWYNPNNWGRERSQGWGTWVFRSGSDEAFAGITDGCVYVQQPTAPYRLTYLTPKSA